MQRRFVSELLDVGVKAESRKGTMTCRRIVVHAKVEQGISWCA